MKNCIKKVVSVILGIIVLFSANMSVFAENKTETVLTELNFGDADNDGRRTVSDARLILRCSVSLEVLTEHIYTYCDYIGDGKITASDARMALRTAVLLENIQCILNGHITNDYTVLPTCDENGYTTQKCTRCNYTDGSESNIVNKLGHKLVETTVAADCTNAGRYTSVCSVCDYVSEDKEIAAAGHTFSEWKTENWVKSRKCKICGIEESEKVTNGKVIYLTFDDGPNRHTERLLGYLAEYDVKATFFVTNQNSNYKYLLKKIVDEGHAIGVHSYSHSWSIYSSTEKFMADFNKMHKLILDETGVDAKIFRFPGGTNNTVSKNYSKGVMSSLASSMTKAGYVYFDWNVDCGDTSGYSASKIAQTTINQISSRKTSVVLMHDLKKNTVDAIKTILEYGVSNGYEFKVLDENSPKIQFKAVN